MGALSDRSETLPDFRFGPFELSASRQALYREGAPVRIQDLPLQALLLLVEVEGRVVSKAELRDRLWGSDTFVEVDPGLYVVIGKLREILGDSAVNPKFIKTVSGRGYQFIGSIHKVPRDCTEEKSEIAPNDIRPAVHLGVPAPPVATSPSPAVTLAFVDDGASGKLPVPAELGHSRRSVRPWGWICLCALIATVAAIALWRVRVATARLYAPPQTIMIGDAEDGSQPSRFDPMLPFLVKLKLQQSPYLVLLPDRAIAALQHDAGYSGRDGELRVCSKLGGSLLLSSQATASARGYRVEVTASRCPDGKILTTQHVDADSEASLLSAVDLVTERLRQRLGEPASSLQRFDTPLVESTTTSLAALKEFTEGERALQKGDEPAAISHFKMAVDLDPAFALGYARLGTLYLNSQEPTAGSEYVRKAFDLRDKVSDKERLYIAGHYYTDVTGELQRAIETYNLWTTLYPRDWGPFNNLANLYDLLGKPEEGLGYARTAAQINPNSGLSTATLAQAYLELSDHAALNKLCKDPAQSSNAFIIFHNICYLSAFSQGDEPEMQRQLAWAHGNPQESLLLGSVASTALAAGKLSVARQALSEARSNAVRNHIPEVTTMMSLGQANADAEFGSRSAAIKEVQDALLTSKDDVEGQAFAAIVLAIAGQDESALRLAETTVRSAPENDVTAKLGLPTVKAISALHQHHAAEAAGLLEASRPELLFAPLKFAPAYYLGMAYLQDRRYTDAAETFESILKNRGVAADSIYVGLSALALGQTRSLQGDRSGAAQAYDQAITIWRNADADFQPGKKAREARSQAAAVPTFPS